MTHCRWLLERQIFLDQLRLMSPTTVVRPKRVRSTLDRNLIETRLGNCQQDSTIRTSDNSNITSVICSLE